MQHAPRCTQPRPLMPWRERQRTPVERSSPSGNGPAVAPRVRFFFLKKFFTPATDQPCWAADRPVRREPATRPATRGVVCWVRCGITLRPSFRGRLPSAAAVGAPRKFLHVLRRGQSRRTTSVGSCPSTPHTGGGTPPRRRGAHRRTEPPARRSQTT